MGLGILGLGWSFGCGGLRHGIRRLARARACVCVCVSVCVIESSPYGKKKKKSLAKTKWEIQPHPSRLGIQAWTHNWQLAQGPMKTVKEP